MHTHIVTYTGVTTVPCALSRPRGMSPTFFQFDMSRTNVVDDDALSYTSTEVSQDVPTTPYSGGVGGHFNFNISNGTSSHC